jgi:SAM-dependent methyltransferase
VEDGLYRQLYEIEERHWWFRGRRAVIWALLGRAGIERCERLLDAGCGTGRNLQEFARLGEAEGVDVSHQAVRFCHERGLRGVREADLTALPYEDGRFDLLLACDVVEHVDLDVAALMELRRVARPGAHLLLTVPAYQWLWSVHDERHRHRRRYTMRRLTASVRSAGWQPAVRTHFNTFLLAPAVLYRTVVPERVQRRRTDYDAAPGFAGGVLERVMRAEARLLERGLRLPLGVSIGLVCRTAEARTRPRAGRPRAEASESRSRAPAGVPG